MLTARAVYKSPCLRVTGKCADSELALQCRNRMCGLEHPLLSGVWLAACMQGPFCTKGCERCWASDLAGYWNVESMNFVLFRHPHRHKNSVVSYPSLRSGEGSQLCVEEFLTHTLLVVSVQQEHHSGGYPAAMAS